MSEEITNEQNFKEETSKKHKKIVQNNTKQKPYKQMVQSRPKQL